MTLAKATVINRVRNLLNDSPLYDICTEAMDTTETGLDVADTTKYDIGDIVEFQDDGERCLVTALASGTTLTVIRNFDVTPGTGTSHNISAAITKRAVFSYHQIEDAVAATLRGLWPRVYKLVAVSITPVNGTQYYEIDEAATNATEMLELSTVRQMNLSSPAQPKEYGGRRSSYPVQLIKGVPTASFGSGTAIYIPRLMNTTNAILVRGIGKVTDTVATTNYSDISDGVEADAVVYLTVARLVAASDISRVTMEDITMSDESVRPGTRTSVAAYWQQQGSKAKFTWEQELARTLPRKYHMAGDGS